MLLSHRPWRQHSKVHPIRGIWTNESTSLCLAWVRSAAVSEGGAGGEPVHLRPGLVHQVAASVFQEAQRGLSVVCEPFTERIQIATEKTIWVDELRIKSQDNLTLSTENIANLKQLNSKAIQQQRLFQ